jgi:hypothetical protein
MTLDIKDLGIREVVAEIIKDLAAGTISFFRVIENLTQSEFEDKVNHILALGTVNFISLKAISVYEQRDRFGSVDRSIIDLKCASDANDLIFKVNTGDYGFIDFSRGHSKYKGVVRAIIADSLSSLIKVTIDTTARVPFVEPLGFATIQPNTVLPFDVFV